MKEHSKLPPSSAARRMACPGSRTLEERYGRKEPTEASKEGELAHELAARYLKQYHANGPCPTGFTDEMHEGAILYADIVTRHIFFKNVKIEERVNIYNVHSEMWGTPDAWGVVDDCSLHVFDYKFGFTPVDVFENWQLLAYACGISNSLSHRLGQIYLHIIQPRDYISSSKHKVWNLSPEQLKNYQNRLTISEILSMSPGAALKVSEQCKYCPARHACPALKQAAFSATEVAFRDIPQELQPQHVGNELKFLHEARDILEFRITALEAEVQHLLQSGTNVEHYELVPTRGRLEWAVDTQSVLEFGSIMGVDLKKDNVLTPTQAIKAGINEELVLKYVERKQSLKLSRVDINKSKAVFKK